MDSEQTLCDEPDKTTTALTSASAERNGPPVDEPLISSSDMNRAGMDKANDLWGGGFRG